MKRFLNVFLLAVILPAFIITGCKDKEDPQPQPKGTFETLSNYMADNGFDLSDVLLIPTKWVVAPELIAKGGIVDPTDNSIPGYYTFDIRSADDFATGHIKGSMNVKLTDVLTKANEVGNEKPILVVCASGQTAGRAVMALRLSGFPDAQVMKFGMSYWNEAFDVWTGNIGSTAVGNDNWVNDASASLPTNAYPGWETTSTDGAVILADAVAAMLAESDWGVSSTTVLNDPLGYNTYNYWDEATYLSVGHYKGTYLYSEIKLDNVSALPTADDCLIYCDTGQTSSIVAAWLKVLGYNSKSIKYGVNSLSYQTLEGVSGHVVWHHSKDYSYETGN